MHIAEPMPPPPPPHDAKRSGKGDAPQSALSREALVSTILQLRSGNILANGSILKSEHFPLSIGNCDRHPDEAGEFHVPDDSASSPQALPVHGAPNYRQGLFNVHGVAQPTLSGLRCLSRLLSTLYDQAIS